MFKKCELQENKMTYPFLISYCGTDEVYDHHFVVYAVDENEAKVMFDMICYRDNIDYYHHIIEPIFVIGPYFKEVGGFARVKKDTDLVES